MTNTLQNYSQSMQFNKIKTVRPDIRPGNSHGTKILVNPYHGCAHRCLFCPANEGFLGQQAFDEFREKGTIYIVENILEHVAAHLSKHPEARVAHLSPVADPFQPIEKDSGLSVKVMEYCASVGLAIAVCSKGIIPDRAQELLLEHPQSFAQISIITSVEEKRRFIVRGGGARVEELLDSISQMTAKGIFVIARIDPVFPYITDDMTEFQSLVKCVKDRGVNHIVSSVADIPYGALEREVDYLNSYMYGLADKYRDLYVERINGRLHARIEYRRRIFSDMLSICKKMGMGFGITWEPSPDGSSLAPEFSSGVPEHLQKDLV